jgi:peptide/nickel transport system permease protein
MLWYLAARLLATIPVLLVVAIVVLLILHFGAGDPAAILAGDSATSAEIAALRTQLGFDQPLARQFVSWILRILSGDLGQSIHANAPVSTLIAQRLGPTLALAASTMCFAVIVAIPLGVLAAWKHNTWIDRGVMALAALFFSFPTFVLGYVLVLGFAIDWRVWPVAGYVPPSQGIAAFLDHLVLPTLTLSSIFIALFARMTRTCMLEALGEDYVRTARAKGLSEPVILFRHALRNCAIPILTVIGSGVALLVGGVVVTETVFNFPGLGRLTVDAVVARDYPTIQGLTLFFAAVYVGINLLLDLTYRLIDPRIEY